MTAPEKSWLLSFWVLFVLGYILICAHITPDDVIVLVASAHLSGLNSICKCSLLSLYKYSLMARSDEAVEFSLGSLLTQTTAFCPPEGILCLSNQNETGTGSHIKSLEETRLSLNEISIGGDVQDVRCRGNTSPAMNVLIVEGLAALICSITVISLSAVGTGEKSLCQ